MWLLTHAPGIKDMLAGIGLSELTLQPFVAALGFAVAVVLGFAAGFVPALSRLPRAHHRHAEDGLTMAIPLSYNVRNVRGALAGHAARDRRASRWWSRCSRC